MNCRGLREVSIKPSASFSSNFITREAKVEGLICTRARQDVSHNVDGSVVIIPKEFWMHPDNQHPGSGLSRFSITKSEIPPFSGALRPRRLYLPKSYKPSTI